MRELQEISALPVRKYPAELTSNFGLTVTESITFPPDLTLKALPGPVDVNKGGISFHQDHQIIDRAIVLNQTFMLTEPRIYPREYPEFLKALNVIGIAQKAYVVLEQNK
jgi:hypothetical protein